MDAGQLRDRVTIEQRGTTRDAAGQKVAGWAALATVWANVRHQSGAEVIRADAEVSVVRASIRLRFREDVTAGMRVVKGSTVYDVKAVLPDSRREFVDLVCETGASGG
jgi:SPP1 family predicted phage head-tail adaptor